jgi:RNA polymerase-binding transcription factor DksA
MKTLYVLCSLMHRHEAIEGARLETAPEAEFCSVCQELRDGLRCL